MRIATWNVNSIRARSESVVSWMVDQDVDVLAMQETKCRDDEFPVMSFLAHGYEVEHVGDGGFNGVALASRIGLDDVRVGFPGQPGFADAGGHESVEARAIGGRCGGVEVWSLYVPNGRALDDPHYRYKLTWLGALRDHAAATLGEAPGSAVVLAGDWNVIPTDDDVWDPEFFAGRTHVSEPERAALQAITDTGFRDSALRFTDGYTFWDYTSLRFPRDEGMRIDYLYCSPSVDARATGARVGREARKGKGASDHAPVILEIDER